jgi:hypothetical protein
MKFWHTDLSKDTGSPWFATHLDFGNKTVDRTAKSLFLWRTKLFFAASKSSPFNLLREFNLHFLVPFHFVQEDYRNGKQLLLVWRWGRSTWEIWDHGADFDPGFFDSLRKKGATASEIYSRIKLNGRLKLSVKNWGMAHNAFRSGM